jgi:hypothetical protein
VFHGFTSSLSHNFLTTNLTLLGNGLQHWEILRLPRPLQELMSHDSLRLGLVSLHAQSLWASIQTLHPDLARIYVSILLIQTLQRLNIKLRSSISVYHVFHCSSPVRLALDCVATPLNSALALLREVIAASYQQPSPWFRYFAFQASCHKTILLKTKESFLYILVAACKFDTSYLC